MAARTLADIDEEITAVRAAYLAALKAEGYSISNNGVSRSIQRSSSADLKRQLDELNRERTRFARGGIKITGGTPV